MADELAELTVDNTIGKFSCQVIKMRTGDMPFSPGVEIIVISGDSSITPELKTDEEIDTYVEMLMKDLYVVAAKAKGLLASAKAETRAIESPKK